MPDWLLLHAWGRGDAACAHSNKLARCQRAEPAERAGRCATVAMSPQQQWRRMRAQQGLESLASQPPCQYLRSYKHCRSTASQRPGHMQPAPALAAELPLQELAARYDDSDSEVEAPQQRPAAQGAAQQPPATPPAAAPPGAGARGDGAAAGPSGSGSEEWDEEEEEEDWDSEDEELASALEWADLREGAAGRCCGSRWAACRGDRDGEQGAAGSAACTALQLQCKRDT